MKKVIRFKVVRLFFVWMLLLLPSVVKAQVGFDLLAVEAYINDHKEQRSLLLARSTLELSNLLLHDLSRDAAKDYKELNVDLDKYTRAFDVIDVMYQSLRTSLNVFNTYNTISGRIGDYKRLLNGYNEKILQRNKIELTDTLILSINLCCIEKIYAEGQQLYHSVSDLVLYITGAAACSTSDLLLVLNSINMSLDNIKLHLNKAYFETWRYIQLRMGYWKKRIYIQTPKQEIIDNAFVRWRESGLNPLRK